jgi:hypothetical protein
VAYAVVGLASAALAGGAATPKGMQLWRLSAFAISGFVVLVHVALERLVWLQPPRGAAVRVGLGGALGGFGLAVAANVHDLLSADGYRPGMLIALLAWPLLTGIPALVTAYLIALVQRRLGRGAVRA